MNGPWKYAGMLTIVLLPLVGCASSGVNKGDFNIVSQQEEWQLGTQLAADIAKQLPLFRDSSARAYLNQMGQRIVNKTELASAPWTFEIVDSPEVNAFSIPGGRVYVNRGLITAADTEAKLTGVLAHEISHVVARHATEQLSTQYGLGIVAGLVLGQNPAVYQQILAQVIGGGALARFSRANEFEADELGVRSMAAAGYDPRGMASMFQELIERERSQPSAVARFFASHPLTSERIEEVNRQIAKMPRSGNLINDRQSYQEFRRRAGS